MGALRAPQPSFVSLAGDVTERPTGLSAAELGTTHVTRTPDGFEPSLRPGRRFTHWRRRYTAAVVVADALAAVVAVAAVGTFFPPASHFGSTLTLLVLASGLAWPVAVAIYHGYDQNKLGLGDDEFRSVLRAGLFAIAAAAVPSAVVDKFGLVSLAAAAIPAAAVLSLVVRIVGRRQLAHSQKQGLNVRRVVLVGSARAVAELSDTLRRDQHGLSIVGVCVPGLEHEAARRSGMDVIGSLEDVPLVAKNWAVDSIAVTGGAGTRQQFLRQLAWSLEGTDIELLVHPGLVEVAGPRMHIRPYVGLPLLHIEQPHFSGWRRVAKRATDLLLTAGFLTVFAPLMIAVAVAIKLEGGPVFYRQRRVGIDGSSFMMWKFRSMHVDADQRVAELRAQNPEMGTLFKMQDDPRITRVGRVLRKFSLDELPQLFNALGGSMSLVGPRPPLQSEVDGYEKHARRRLLVTPGLTGLWQVSGRSLLSWEESVRLDLRYVENWTLTLDLLIIWKTFAAVATRRGAY